MNFSFLHSRRLPKRSLLFAAIFLLILSLLASYYFKIQPSIGYEKNQLEHYLHSQQNNYQELIKDSALMKRLVQQNETLNEFEKIADKEYSFFLFVETLSGNFDILFWNNQKIFPPNDFNAMPDGEYFKLLSNGYYFIIKKTIRLSGLTNNVISYALIPVLYQYEIETDYLLTHFVYNKNAINKVSISAAKTSFPVQSLNNNVLFYLARKAHTTAFADNPISSFLRIMAFVLLLVYLHFMSESITRKRGIVKGVIFLIALLICIRAVTLIFPNLFGFKQFNLFTDLTIYSANWFNRSLGDLLINIIIFCWIVVWLWYNIGPTRRLPSFLQQGNRIFIASGIALFFLILSTFQLANIVRSLIRDSKISFAVTDFFSLDIYSVVGFIVLALLSLTYYYFTRILFHFIFPVFKGRTVFIYFIIAVIGLIYLTIRSGNNIVLFHIPVLLWLLLYTLLLSQEQLIINRFKITIAGMLFWIFVFSVSLAAVLMQENQAKELITRKGIAEKHEQLTDFAGESTLSIALTYLDDEFFVRSFQRLQDENSNRILRDSILRETFSGYSNKYNTQLFFFDSSNRGLFNEEPRTFAELNNIFSIQSKPTRITDLNYYESAFDQFTYITRKIITDTTGPVGSFFVISTPKKYNADALYPQLFKQINHNEVENSPIYSYAIYVNNVLTRSSSKYPFPITLTRDELPKSEFEQRINNTYDELWYRASGNKIVVVVKKRDSVLESITLFSYLFCAFLFMVALLKLITVLLKVGSDYRELNVLRQLSIRAQVHSTIIFISILSFLIIGTATISFFINRYQKNNEDKLSRTAGIMVTEMQKRVADNNVFDDVVKIYDSVANNDLQKLINEIADIHNVDVNVYDLDGNLKVSSEADVYRQGVLSTKIHPEAFYHLDRLRKIQYVQEETMSSLRYLSIYSAVRDEDGKVYAYLNIPYFSAQIDLKQEISNFLVTIINLNALIFLIAGVIALFITNRITRSFSVISNKMKEITLGKANEEIVWTRDDEIGELVKHYNKMVQQLEQSAQALAKSEREGAWREMARQVAHEIKNPLTPMKLSIQYLQKAVDNNQPNIKELTTNVSNTLVEQIDHLSKIAADFARFANIGNRNIEMFDLHQVIESLKDLYGSDENVKIKWEQVEGSIVIKGDKTHMNRLFTNLLSNAVDACKSKDVCQIKISEERREGTALIKIADSGEGIPEEMQSKIFTPNFTTKTSGTGLGLAMCKSIVEQAKGSIWFETEPGKGTTFFIELPIVS